MHHKPNDEAADANLRSHVKELRDDPAHQMLVGENSAPTGGSFCLLGRRGFADLRQVREVNHRGYGQENAADDQVRHANRSCLCGAIRLQDVWAETREYIPVRHRRGEDERSDNQYRHDGAHGVERLREIQPPLAAFRRAENRRVGIRRNFEEALPASQHERGKQEQSVNAERACRDEKERSSGAETQAGENAALVTDALHQAPSDNGRKTITAKERNLNEGGLKVAQAERGFEMRNENVVQIDAEGPQEKQTGNQDEGQNVFSFRERRVLRGQVFLRLLFGRGKICRAVIPRPRLSRPRNLLLPRDGDVKSPLRQSAVEMHVAAVHQHVLARDVARLRRNEKENHGRDFFGLRHSLPQRNF